MTFSSFQASRGCQPLAPKTTPTVHIATDDLDLAATRLGYTIPEPACPEEDFIDFRARDYRRYLETFATWTAGLDPEELSYLEVVGADQPDKDGQQLNGQRSDVSDHEWIPEPDDTQELTRPEADVLVRVLLLVAASDKPGLIAEVILSLLGQWGFDESGPAMAKRHGISKQRFSTTRLQVLDTFGLRAAAGSDQNVERRAKRRKAPDWLQPHKLCNRLRRWINRTLAGYAPEQLPLDVARQLETDLEELHKIATEIRQQAERFREQVELEDAE